MTWGYGVIEAKAGGGASPAGARVAPPALLPCPGSDAGAGSDADRQRALADPVPASTAGKHMQCPARLTPCLSNLFCHLSLPNVSLFCLSHLVCHSFVSLHN